MNKESRLHSAVLYFIAEESTLHSVGTHCINKESRLHSAVLYFIDEESTLHSAILTVSTKNLDCILRY